MEPVHHRRVAPEGVPLLVGVGGVLLGHHPLGGALEEAQLFDPVGDGGNHLDSRGTGPYDADPLPVQRHHRVPAGGVDRSPGEGPDPLYLGERRVVEHSGGGNHNVDHVVCAERGLDVPATVQEVAPDHLFAEADRVHHAMGLRDILEVAEDLGAW